MIIERVFLVTSFLVLFCGKKERGTLAQRIKKKPRLREASWS